MVELGAGHRVLLWLGGPCEARAPSPALRDCSVTARVNEDRPDARCALGGWLGAGGGRGGETGPPRTPRSPGAGLARPEPRPARPLTAGGTLWPEVREESARASLRNALVAARRALGDGERHLLATRDRVGLGPPGEVEVDVQRAAALAAEGRHRDAARPAARRPAARPGRDWVHDARERHRTALAGSLAALADAAEAAGDLADAVRLARAGRSRPARRGVPPRADPPADLGRPRAARAAYDRLRDLLRERLGVAPDRADAVAARRPPGREASDGPRAPELPAALRRRPRSPLAGRDRETAALRAAWDAAVAGGPRVAVLSGEPGVGKTRLAGELARHVHGRGARVLLGRAREGAAALHGPLAEALRPEIEAARAPARTAGGRARALGAGAGRPPAATARGRPRGRPLPAGRGGGGRAGRRVRGRAGAAACIDDAQWMDGGSATLLAHSLRVLDDRPLLVLLTRRDDSAGPPALEELLAEARAEDALLTLAVEPVDLVATAAIVEGWAGSGAPAPLVGALHDRTGGNPFCVEETLRELEESGVLGRGAWPGEGDLGLPAGVREAVTRRLDRLEERERWLLRIAAVMGSAVSADGLEACARAARASGAAPGRARARPRRPGARHRGPPHPGGGRRRRVRLRPRPGARDPRGGAVVRPARAGCTSRWPRPSTGTGGRRRPLAAYHLAEAGAEADPQVAADTACSAAEQAMAQAAYEQAAVHLERTLAHPRPRGGAPRRPARAPRPGARAGGRGRRTPGAAFDQAVALARAVGDGVLLARAAIGAGGPRRGGDRRGPGALGAPARGDRGARRRRPGPARAAARPARHRALLRRRRARSRSASGRSRRPGPRATATPCSRR